jgi:hypothetical protein
MRNRAQPGDRKAAGDPGGTYSARRPALPGPLFSRPREHRHGQPLPARRAGDLA